MEETFTKAIDILYLAKQNDVDIILNGDQLQLKIREDKTIDNDLLEKIRANKKLLIDFLSNENLRSSIVSNGNHKITTFNRSAVSAIPLSFSQERLWFIDRREGSIQYHLPIVLRLKGNLNKDALSKALIDIVNRHEVLRTVYEEDNGQLYQRVKAADSWQLKESDGRKYLDDQQGLDDFIQQLTLEPFDLQKDDMVRADLMELGEQEHILVVTLHHIASDASSMPVLVREVAALYAAYVSDVSPSLPALALQYSDYSVWQRNHIQGAFLEEKLKYWKNKLEDVVPLQLPTDHIPSLDSARNTTVSFDIDTQLSQQVQALGQRQGATLYMTLLAAFKVLLYRYSGQEDICVGTSIAGRPQRELEGLIGFFANTLALRDEVKGEMPFTQLLEDVKGTTLDAYGHQEVPFEKIVEAVVKERTGGINPLFQVMLVLINTPEVPVLKLGELSLSVQEYEQTTTKFNLTFFIRETKTGFKGAIQYNTDLYSQIRIQRMAAHFKELLRSVVANPQAAVGKLEILSEVEKSELTAFGRNKSEYPAQATVTALFEAHALQTPDVMAIVFEQQQLSYRALDERANQLAHYLRSKGVKEDTMVPLLIERGIDMLIGMLGILKAGGAYVPIDTDFPEDRISYMLEDTRATVVITSSTSSYKIPNTAGLDIIELDEERTTLRQQPSAKSVTDLQPDNLAYIIYTSGSTGKPKGVEISHRNLVDYVYGLDERTGISKKCQSFALVSSIATDLGNTVLYGSLLTGGTLHLFSKEMVSHIEDLHEYFNNHQIDCLKIVPSHWKALTMDGQPLLPQKLLVFGGEALTPAVIELIRQTGTACKIVNHYGPTETTIGKLLHVVEDASLYDHVIPIGKPFSNTRTYILNKELSPCPVGVPGQLFIAGTGVARGYLNRPDLTAEKFIQNHEGERMYATGDRVSYQGDGNIVFIGRVDDQVKIRGYRVEPGEVGRILEGSEQVAQAVVLAREDKQGNKQLVGYIVPKNQYDKAGLQSYLKEQLPDYMIPAHLVELESLPMTANGKIDRKALPDPEATATEGAYTAPRNQAEEKLAELWQDVLELDEVGINDDFFGIGGHSLLAVRLISLIRKTFGVELPIADVFDYPTVGQLAARITGEPTEELLPAVKAEDPRPDYIPLSFSQERLWFIDRLEGSAQYNLPAVLRLKGQLNEDILEKTLKAIIARHEVLRTVIKEHEGQGYQAIMPAENWALGKTTATAATNTKRYIEELITKPFDFSNDYMLRADLIKVAEEDHILVVTMHHIASDGWSRAILVKEVVELYDGYAAGKEATLPELPVQYADYAIWQRKYMEGRVLEEKLGYWKNKLDEVATLELPADYARPAIQRLRGAMLNFGISKELSAQVNALSQQNGATLYMTLLAAFKVLLYKYSGQEDICVGTTVAGRNQQELEGIIGFFINTLALRSQVKGESSFTNLLSEVKKTTLEAYSHQEVPFEKVVDAVVKGRDMSRSPLFQVLFSLQNTPEIPELKLGGLSLSAEGQEHNTSRFDIAFMVRETSTGIHITIEYNTDLYRQERISRMTAHFTQLLQSVVASPQTAVGKLEILSQTENEELDTFANSEVSYPENKTVTAIFEEHAKQTPETIALVFGQQQLSYRALNERANQLAHYLRSKGVKEDTLVPLLMERGPDMLIGLLGILKAGGAYVPIDTDFPEDRVSYMLEDTKAMVVVTSSTSSYKIPKNTSADIIELDEERSTLRQLPSANPETSLQPQNLAYVIYTSGSTGKPKGVEISHRNLVDYVYGIDNKINISSSKSFALVSSIATDLGNTVLYGSLMTGGTLHVFTKETVSHIEELHEYFNNHEIDCLKIVPSHWKALSMDGKPLLPKKLLVFGGEALTAALIDTIRETNTACRIVNHYGPTETTIGKLLHEVAIKEENHYEQVIPIGKPFSNTKTYILNKEMSRCPVGIPGQLYIAGTGVARGYLDRPELTKEKFVPNPFDNGKTTMYGTGDRVAYQKDGNIIFIGRVDDQVKIRGYRVEPGEVGRILEQSELVAQAVVLAREDKQGNKQLVGYIVSKGTYDRQGIQSYLKEQLPDYMIPAHLVELESLPMTANGKIDRKALPDPESTTIEGQYTAPGNETEEKLAELWQDVLELEEVGMNDDFFGIGGHSLLAVRLISLIRKTFGVELPIADVFDYPTVGQLAARITGGENTEELLPPVTAEARPEHIPLSFSQERLWFIDRLEGSTQYHIPAVLNLKGKLNRKALESAIGSIINRHEILRTVILEDNEGEGYQQIMPLSGWELVFEDNHFNKGESLLRQHIGQLIAAPFDLSTDYKLRANLIRLSEDEHILVVTLHHIASDGWSRSVLVKELVELYASYEKKRPAVLPILPVQYADYAIWQRKYLQGEVLDNKLSYWKTKLTGVAPLQLPTDYNRPSIQSSRGAICRFKLDKELSAQLQALSHQQNATLYMTLLAAFNILLYRYSGQEDICVGTPVAGRSQQELEGLIGFFINTIALRSNVSGDTTFSKLLEDVKATTLEAYSHQEVPFEKVVDALVTTRNMSRSPLFQVLFSLQNTPDTPDLKLGEISLAAESQEHTTAKFDVSFLISETNNGIKGTVEYSTDLYKEETIVRMIGHYVNLLGSIVISPEEQAGRLSMLNTSEEATLLKTFNDTAAVSLKDKSVITLFEEQVSKTPDATAVIFGNEQLTYQELNERSNQVARYLQKQGVKAETLVPICVSRSLEMMTGILGIMKAGGAYVPIDPEYPQGRISYMLEDTGATIALCTKATAAKLVDKVKVIALDDQQLFEQESTGNIEAVIGASQLAYIIYTSGSTGKPKGVMIEHQNLVSYLCNNKTKYIDSAEGNKAGSFIHLSYTFDASLTGMFMPLIAGRYIVIGANDALEVFTDENLTKHAPYDFIKITPSHIGLLPTTFKTKDGSWLTKKLVLGGEALRLSQFEPLVKEGVDVEVINEYGPTEATVGCSTYRFNTLGAQTFSQNEVPIGKPIDNTHIYILNPDKALSPVGVTGELYIGGDGLARGYLNRDELTKERFISDPFSKEPGARLYRTGDIGRWLADGTIEYQGRIDDQVKIRGYRIELGEIESILNESEKVSQGVVLAKADKQGSKRLVAYVVPNGTFDKQAIQEYLSSKLPDYMVPALWVELTEIPLTSNGKADKRALPDPEIADLSAEYVAPRNETEEALVNIWQELLGVERVGIYDNFFELGGHSLLAMRVVSAIKRELEVELNIRDLFINPNIFGLGEYLNKQNKGLSMPAIVAVQRPDHIPLSFSQERLWFIDQLEGSIQYHIPAIIRLKGDLNRDALEKTLQVIIGRHEVLRTVIFEDTDGTGYQQIKPEAGWSLTYEDRTGEDKIVLVQYTKQLVQKPFDLSKDYMLRANLLKVADDQHILVVTMHHIASDGWSASVLVKEVVEIYKAYIENREVSLPALLIQYADYAIWQRNWLQGEVLENKLDYWKTKLDGVSPLQLPTDHNRPAIQSSRGASYSIKINKELVTQLKNLSYQHGATLYMTLLSAFKILLYRYSGQEDICVGIPVAGRQQHEVEGLIGFFINTLALRSRVSAKITFNELLDGVKANTLEAYAHQEVPFEKVVDAVVKERNMGRSPLFQVMFSLQNTPDVPELKLGELSLSTEGQKDTTTKFDIVFLLSETSSGIQGTIEYSTDIYKEDTISRMLGHYLNLLGSIVSSSGEQVSRLKMLEEAEEGLLLDHFNNTASSYPKDKGIIALFEEQVINDPDKTALIFGGEELTYNQLNERSNQVAHYLRQQGVKPGTLVPICVERSLEMMIGILGILKAGGAYVPIDPDYPAERISHMLEDTGAQLVLSSRASHEKLAGTTQATIIELEGGEEQFSDQLKTNLEIKTGPADLAYIIYTSGSTGKPKGAMIEQRSVVSLVKGVTYVSLNKEDTLLVTGSPSFDATTFEYWGMLLNGGKLVLSSLDELLDSEKLKANIDKHKVNIMWFTSSWFNQLADNSPEVFAGLRTVLAGGEKLSEQHIEKIREQYPNLIIINGYGPTENTTFSLTYKINKVSNPIPIGIPLNNRKAYVLNANQELVPIGVTGEIYLGGAGLARGYHNRPELTAEKFVADPFETGERLYRTGDLGRWLPEGNIEYQGRIDDQVKIRGYRIELGEIEGILNQSPVIQQAVVLAKEDKQGTRRLVAYVVADGEFDKQTIQSYLGTKLPDYMVPAIWVELTSMPLTSNGKADRRALPDPDMTEMTAEYVAPRNETEAKLAQIWKDLLDLKKVGIYDNFFELGGHSLLAMRVVSAIRKELDVEISIRDLFVNPVIADLASYLDKQNKGSLLPAITAAERPEYIPLSFSQERLWFIDSLEGSIQYHIPAVIRLKGELNLEALKNTLRSIINRHEVLRTVILEHEGQGYQHIMTADNWTLKITGNPSNEAATAVLSKYISQLISNPFDLAGDYMLRAELIEMAENDHILVATMHHIASDGWSRSILVKEVAALYEGYTNGRESYLPVLPVQYADYAIWQRNWLQGEVLETKLNYWKKKLAGVASLQLPLDYSRPVVQSSKGATGTFSIDKELTARLRSLSHEHGATLYMTLLAAFNVLLYRYSGQEDICVGTPVAGRNQHEIEGLIGFFINTLALRSQVSGDMPFINLLSEIKNTTLEAYANQEVPFEKIVDAVVTDRDRSRSPLFQVLFNLLNTPDVPKLEFGGLNLSGENQEHTTAQYDITFAMTENGSGINGTVEYSTDLFKAETIQRMMGHYANLLGAIVASPAENAGNLAMLSDTEEQTLLLKFNQTAADYPNDKCVITLFEEQAAGNPDAVAIVFEKEQLSYKELNERSNQLAHYLKNNGVTAETLVPICIERGLGMVIGILGILKAGGTYVPVDPEYPQDRISYMLEDTGAQIVISSRLSRSKVGKGAKLRIIELDGDRDAIGKEARYNPGLRISSGQLAYVIYTSGSTGKPKGVMIEHGSLMNLLTSISAEVDFTPAASFLSVTTYSFDICYLELYMPLINGAKLIVVPRETAADGFALAESLSTYKPTHMQATPTTWQILSEAGWTNEGKVKMLIGGEAVKEGIKDYLTKIGEVWNVYGPTETTIWSTIKKLAANEKVTIGKPISNTQVYILRGDNELSPIGVAGEICIGGDGLARGYLNRPELTAEKFVSNNFSNEPGARLYKTGDLGRWLADGNLEHLGRIDDQVKIRGYRIELGEIDNVLNQSERVSQGVVVAKEDKQGNKRLVGYVVAAGVFDKQAIQAYLNSKLPEFMVPSLWVELTSLPLTPNGKIDRKALPDAELTDMTAAYVAAQNVTEQELATIWQRLLGVEQVGIYDNFFELGGHSLLAMRVVGAIRKRLNVELSIRELFVHPNVAELAAYLNANNRNKLRSLIPIKTAGTKPPLYIICGAGGTVFKFREFVQLLDPDQPVYGLQQFTEGSDPDEFPDTIQGIAARYIEEMVLDNPDGPYALSGHCLGGTIAFEMAKQLEAMGKRVLLLAMFDANVKEQRKTIPPTLNNFYHIPAKLKRLMFAIPVKIKFELFLLTRHPKQALLYKITKVKPLFGIPENKPENIEQDVFDGLTLKLEKAFGNYKIDFYNGDILLFAAMQHYFFVDTTNKIIYKEMPVNYESKYAWRKYARSVKTYEVKGEHSTIFNAVNAAEFSRILQHHLNESLIDSQDMSKVSG